MTLMGIAGALLLILLTGYLIIYNIFQISVLKDVRYYGLLKTIGATGRQIRRILRQQAWCSVCLGRRQVCSWGILWASLCFRWS